MELTLCAYNVENLFVSMDYYEGQDLESLSERDWRKLALSQFRQRQKPLKRLWGLAEAILDIGADVFMLSEVGGRESLENFSRHFLKDRYEPLFVEGNSRRSIDLGFLVRKGFAWEAEALSNRETPVEVAGWQGKYLARFSRDVAELRLRESGVLRMILLLVHLKSMISTREDPNGKDVRTAEAAALASLYARRKAEFPGVPVAIGGDFNSDIKSQELELLARTDLVDFHDVLGTPREERDSLVHFGGAGDARGMVIDYLLLSPELRDRVVAIKSRTYRYKTFHEITREQPTTPAERARLPSDHYPVVVTLRMGRPAEPGA